MNYRDRIVKALSHEESDKIPVDFGSTAVTGMHVSCVSALRDYYGIEKRPVKVFEPYQMLGWIDDDLLDAIEISTVGIFGPNNLFGFPNENWKEFRMPWGQIVLVSEHFKTTKAPNGDLLIYPGGDTSVPPSGRMPSSGFFFDTIIRQEPIDEEKLNPEDNLEEFKPISNEELKHIETQMKNLASTERAIVASFGGTGLGDIALVPAPFLKHPKGIRDVAEWYISTITRQDYINEVFFHQCEIGLKKLEKIYSIVGNNIDVIFTCGTDFGTQNSLFCSSKTFDNLYAPYYRKINDWIHENTTWKIFKHSCGAIEPLMQSFIDVGFDIINPVQCSADGMDALSLKEKYGDKIVFWGGGANTQRTVPFGTPEEIREEVLERCEIFSKNGGFVFNSIHNIQANTPVNNVVAMIDAVKEFNGEL